MNNPHGEIRKAIAILENAAYELNNDRSFGWYHTGLGEVGVREVVGNLEHNPRILEYLQTCHRDQGGNLRDWGADRDETPWCSAFVGWCLLRSEIEPTRSAAARSWERWGFEVEAQRGAIAVLTRPGGGHVGFVDRVEGDMVYLLGGNQRNAVNIRPYPVSRVLTYRWPKPAS